MAHQKAHITAEVLRWARESQGYDLSTAASKAGREIADLESWESGEATPTLAQARKLAEVYRRPLAVFFLPSPPKDFQAPKLPDFRRLADGTASELSPALRTIVRLAFLRQEWAREQRQRDGETPLPWVGAAKGQTNVRVVTEKIHKWLTEDKQTRAKAKNNSQALQAWIDRVERGGAFVFQTGGPLSVEASEARGLALFDEYAPFIVINGGDSETGRIFTLMHEVVHLWIGEPGISNLEPLQNPRTNEQRVEKFCNEVAAEILLPAVVFTAEWRNSAAQSEEQRIEAIAERHHVSREMVALRGVTAGFIQWARYMELRKQYRADWQEARRQQSETTDGGPRWTMMVPKRASYALTRLVLTRFADGRISGGQAVELLNAKLNHFPDVAAYAGVPWNKGVA